MYRPQARTLKIKLTEKEAEVLTIFLQGELKAVEETKDELSGDPMVEDETMLLALADGYDFAKSTLNRLLTTVNDIYNKFGRN